MPNTDQLQQMKSNHAVNVVVKVAARDLPLSCPLPSMSLWDMHPKVYLALDHDDQAVCPYCGAQYVLANE